MIIQQAFTNGGKAMLKGGLHCHTTRSDGKGSPEEVIKLHKANGYDFLALTDHRFYNYANFSPETEITIIPGMEFDDTFYSDLGFRCFHTVAIGPSREDGNGFEQDQRFDSGTAKDQDGYQNYLDWLHVNKNLTIYCHPEWSSTPARYFERLRGNFAMEIWNSGCAMSCDMDTDAAYWDELLGHGQRIFGVATDDGHGMAHHCNGWVRVNAENSIPAILKALEEGAFYSSCGPEIYNFYVDNENVAHVECSPAASVKFISDCHPSRQSKSGDGSLTEAKFALGGQYRYIRARVTDAEGRRAWTNPIFLD